MSRLEPTAPFVPLRREIGILSATMMGLGAIIGTGLFVGIGSAADAAGAWVVVAIGVAGIVACFNGLSSAQLAAAHPVSGGTYEYGYRWLNSSLGFTAGWMFLCAKSASAATAALGLSGYGLQWIGGGQDRLQLPVAIMAVVIVTFIAGMGLRQSAYFNTVMVSMTLSTIGYFCLSGVCTWFQEPESATLGRLTIDSHNGVARSGFLEACALMFVAYTGYGRIATLGEEIRNPGRSIPIAMILTLLVSMWVYLGVAWIGIMTVGPEFLGRAAVEKAAPLEAAARTFALPATHYIISIGAMTSMFSVLLNLVLGLSRVALAMGRRGDLPSRFSVVDPSSNTPTNSVVFIGALIVMLVLIGNIKTTWSFSAFTVLIYYAITNMAAIRMSDHERRYPRTIAWLGLLSCLFLAFWVDRQVWMIGLTLIAVGLVYHRVRLHRR